MDVEWAIVKAFSHLPQLISSWMLKLAAIKKMMHDGDLSGLIDSFNNHINNSYIYGAWDSSHAIKGKRSKVMSKQENTIRFWSYDRVGTA
jgi:hypothetical protein